LKSMLPRHLLANCSDGVQVCDGAPPPPYAAWALGPQCPLFARKFGPHTAPAVFAAFADCANGLRIASDGC